VLNFGYAVFEWGLCKRTDKQAYFGDVFDLLCIAMVVDPRLKLSLFDSADRHRRAPEAMVRAMETTTSSSNE